MNDKEKFVIIDGNAILHRAYHALPPLTNASGKPTGAVFGFFSMLLKIIQEVNPSYVAVAFDRPKPTFRQNLYVGYQAQRPKMAEDLGDQIISVHKLLEEVKIPIFEVDGFEADDVIGTLSFRLTKNLKLKTKKFKEKTEVIIVTGDRDMLQLVNGKVKILAPVVGISKMYLYDSGKVREKFGINSSQMISYKALIGDASDNYPGVAGIGPKTAMELLGKYKDLEGIYKHIREIEKENPKLAIKLAQGQESAMMCKTLATIVQDVPLYVDFEECRYPKVTYQEFDRTFEKFGFRTLRKRLAEVFNKPSPIDGEQKPQKKRSNQLQLID